MATTSPTSGTQTEILANASSIQAFEPTLRSPEAAALIGIHPKTLQKMARAGTIPARRVGNLWRFRATELDEWFREGVSSDRHSCRN